MGPVAEPRDHALCRIICRKSRTGPNQLRPLASISLSPPPLSFSPSLSLMVLLALVLYIYIYLQVYIYIIICVQVQRESSCGLVPAEIGQRRVLLLHAVELVSTLAICQRSSSRFEIYIPVYIILMIYRCKLCSSSNVESRTRPLRYSIIPISERYARLEPNKRLFIYI